MEENNDSSTMFVLGTPPGVIDYGP